jgi:uncharacterized membrane protein
MLPPACSGTLMPLYALIIGAVVFFGAHLFSTFRSRGETGLRAKLGYRPYMGLFTLVSLIGLALFAWGWANMRPWPQVWSPPDWARHIPQTVMPIAMILLAAAYTPVGFIKKTVKHPMLLAVKVWAAAHLCANGDLGAIILFGSFLLYAVIDRIALARRGDKGPVGVKPSFMGDMMAIAAGLAAYLVIVFWLHPLIVGVPVF